jgi:hypothetical protein
VIGSKLVELGIGISTSAHGQDQRPEVNMDAVRVGVT